MIFFITVLRALAACLITNSHYNGIYPTNLIANGGLIGDVLFFAVSGYCLYHVKAEPSLKGFGRWYGRRLWRVYPPVLIITAVYMVLGAYSLSENSFFWWYLYPTYYHFVASIVVLYVPFFLIMKTERLRENLPALMAGIAAVWLLVYFLFYDRSYYHIDVVREPMIRFLFMESMLLGAWFRQHDAELRGRYKRSYPLVTLAAFLVYFATKLLFSRRAAWSQLQWINQLTIFVLLYCLFRTFSGLDPALEKLPEPLKTVIRAVADRTLEIYAVQYVLIDRVRGLGLPFPVNWLVLTAVIWTAACILHKVCDLIYARVEKIPEGTA